MARRNGTTDEQAPVNTDEQAPVNQDDSNTLPTDEAPKAEETVAPIDLTAFQAAAQAAVDSRDTSTGVVSLDMIEPVNVEFRKLDGIKAKNAAKNFLDEGVKDAISVEKLDAVLARAYSTVKEGLVAGKSTPAERAPVDPKAAFVNKVAAHQLAWALVTEAPEGVNGEEAMTEVDTLVEGLAEQVTAYQTWLDLTPEEGQDKPDAPEVSPVVRAAFKLASGKASGSGRVSTGSGVRHDMSKHIIEAFADKEDGAYLSVADIAKFRSDEYGDDEVSQGAISARLFPSNGGETTVKGVRQTAQTADRVKGATKDSSKA